MKTTARFEIERQKQLAAVFTRERLVRRERRNERRVQEIEQVRGSWSEPLDRVLVEAADGSHGLFR